MNNCNNELKSILDERVRNLYKIIDRSKLTTKQRIKGCSELEITNLKQTYNQLYFPYSYEVFLRHFGHGFAPMGNEFEYLYEDALLLTQYERDIERELKEEGNLNPEELLPEKAFVFAKRQGMQLWYFIAQEGIEDSPVFYDPDGGGNAIKMYESIFDFWEERVG